jgi:hypothetical protein
MLALPLVALVAAQTPEAPPPQLQPPQAAAPSASGLSSDALRHLMHTYVRGERTAAIPFAFAGVAQALAGSLLFISDADLAHGAAWPLIAFGAVEIIAAVVLGVRSQEPKLDALLDQSVPEFLTHERAHAHRIVHVYQPLLLIVEGAVVAAGGVMAGIGAAKTNQALEGVGFGLAIGALALFLLDWAVLDRALAYEAALNTP